MKQERLRALVNQFSDQALDNRIRRAATSIAKKIYGDDQGVIARPEDADLPPSHSKRKEVASVLAGVLTVFPSTGILPTPAAQVEQVQNHGSFDFDSSSLPPVDAVQPLHATVVFPGIQTTEPLVTTIALDDTNEGAPSSITEEKSMGQYFPETGEEMSGKFLDFWNRNGGLAVFGYPITSEQMQMNRDLGKEFPTQWMERNRFEYHPEANEPYKVQLGRLGEDLLIKLGRGKWYANEGKGDPNAPYFDEVTHKNIAPEFYDYVRTHGLNLGLNSTPEARSMALFGRPLSMAKIETNMSGDTVLTQWFERARIELHPNNPPEHRIQLGLLGNELRTLEGNPPPTPEPEPVGRPKNIDELLQRTQIMDHIEKSIDGQSYTIDARATQGKYSTLFKDEVQAKLGEVVGRDSQRNNLKNTNIIIISDDNDIPVDFKLGKIKINLGYYRGEATYDPYEIGEFDITREGERMTVIFKPRTDLNLADPAIQKGASATLTDLLMSAVYNDGDSTNLPQSSDHLFLGASGAVILTKR